MSSILRTAQASVRRAFTLIEMLVVVGIIVILLAILIPSLRGALEASNRAGCASNLKQHYGAVMAYYNTFNRTFPQSYNDGSYSINLSTFAVTITNAVNTNPMRWQVNPVSNGASPLITTPVINISNMRNYMGVNNMDVSKINADPSVLGGVWRCPSADARDSSIVATTTVASPYGYIEGWYSYFCMPSWPGAGTATATTSQPTYLTTRNPDNKCLIFAETLFCSGSKWSYNHGKNGFNDYRISGCDTGTSPTNFLGMNQTFGDGSTRWSYIDPKRTTPTVPYNPAITGVAPVPTDWAFVGNSVASGDRNFVIVGPAAK